MKRTAAICVVLVLSLVSSVYAIYTVTDTGTWPKSWPAELEPLRKQARTFEGPKQPLQHHAIPFTKRDEFESAWPHLLKVKSKGAPIVLRRAPSFWLGDKATAGVCVHTPPAGEAPIADGKDAKGNWEETIYIELIVDGEIIDLNRIHLPDDSPIIDERFKDGAAAVPIEKDAKWNPPQVAHTISNDFSTYCIHDDKTAAFVIAYQGDFGSSDDGSSSNSKARLCNQNVKLTLKTPDGKEEVAFRRDSTAPNKLTFAEKDYDLTKGRVFLVLAGGTVRQLAIEAPIVRDAKTAAQLKTQIAAIPPQTR